MNNEDLKSYIKGYLTNRKYSYTKLDKHDRAIEVLINENERLLNIAKKMHTWIFLHTGDEQEVYDELGLTDEENTLLGYGGQFILGDKENESN